MGPVTESALVFGRNHNLFGIISESTQGAKPGPAVILLNAGILHRVGPSRVGVEVARELAANGHRVLRFDLSGIGDSPRASSVATLSEIVRGDIADAIDVMANAADGRVILFGICSGADNAFHVASEDDRVLGLVLIDPTIHSTPMFRLRAAMEKATSLRSWWNVLSGRSAYLRLRRRFSGEVVRPPGYYGLLTLEQPAAASRARLMAERGVHFLYVVTKDMQRFCNYPGQISDSLGGAVPKRQLTVEWRFEADHMLRREIDRRWLAKTIRTWLDGLTSARSSRKDVA